MSIRPRNGERGFTLIELLIAVTVVSIGLLAVASTPITVMKGGNRAQRLTEASYGAMDQIEKLMIQSVSSVNLAVGNHSTQISQGSITYTVQWVVTNLEADGSRKQIAVTVQWSEHGVAKQHQYAYVKTNFM